MPDRRQFLTRSTARLAALAAAGGPAGAALARGEFPEIQWEDLVPRDWDPLKEFDGMDMAIGLPDSDPRAQALLAKLREVWDRAPAVTAMDGRKIRLPGFVVPLDAVPEGLSAFLLVPYFGACIHTPPPPANQIVQVHTHPPARLRTMDAVWVRGTLRLERQATAQGVAAYRLEAAGIEPYVERVR